VGPGDKGVVNSVRTSAGTFLMRNQDPGERPAACRALQYLMGHQSWLVRIPSVLPPHPSQSPFARTHAMHMCACTQQMHSHAHVHAHAHKHSDCVCRGAASHVDAPAHQLPGGEPASVGAWCLEGGRGCNQQRQQPLQQQQQQQQAACPHGCDHRPSSCHGPSTSALGHPLIHEGC